MTRAAAIGWAALMGMAIPAVAQHESHGSPVGSVAVALTGTAHGAEGAPLSGAIIRLFHGSGTGRHVVATGVTNIAGRFAVRTVAGTYTLEISYPWHALYRQQVTLAATPLDLGTMRLRFRVMELDAVTARVERDEVKLRSGFTVVNTRSSAAAGGSIADFLRTVPGVDLDADGRISMRGSSAVLLLMNGRGVALTGEALAAFLRQMPAAALERIEAGTTVSARQAADGAGGAVNLVFPTHAERPVGMRSFASSIASNDQYMASAAATGDVGQALNWDLTYSLSSMRPSTHSRTARWSQVPGDLPLQTDQDSRARERHRLHSFQAGAAVAPTPTTSLALRGAYSWMQGGYWSNSAFLFTNAQGDTASSTTGSRLEHVIPSGEVSVAGSVDGGAARFSSEVRAGVINEDFRGAYSDEGGGYTYMTNTTASRQRALGLRNELDLRLPGVDLGVGHESRFRNHTATHEAIHFDATWAEAFRYDLDVHAGYLNAKRSVGAVRAEAGLRLEADRTHNLNESAGGRSRSAVRFFPSVRGEWTDARRALMYRFAYGRRINRPSAEMLNPFTMGGDDMNEIIGNPSLLPEISDQVELGMERHRSRSTVQLTPFVRWTGDPIRQLKAATPNGGATTRVENLTRARAIGADASVRAQPAGGAVVTLAGSIAHLETTGHELRRRGAYATARLTVDLRVTENTSALLYAYRRGAQVIEQGRILPAFSSELALTQRLARDRGRVTLRLNDPLRSDRHEVRIRHATFAQESSRRTTRPLLSLFLSYAVGGPPREDMAPTERVY